LLPVVVVAAAAISNIAQISFLQTLAAKKQKYPPRKRGKKNQKHATAVHSAITLTR